MHPKMWLTPLSGIGQSIIVQFLEARADIRERELDLSKRRKRKKVTPIRATSFDARDEAAE